MAEDVGTIGSNTTARLGDGTDAISLAAQSANTAVVSASPAVVSANVAIISGNSANTEVVSANVAVVSGNSANVALTDPKIAERTAAVAARVEAELKSADPAVKAAAEKLKTDLASADPAVKAAAEAAVQKKIDYDTKVPETYEAPKLPEGTVFDDARFQAFVPLAKELSLTQAGVQKLTDFFAQARIEDAKAGAAAWTETTTKWEAETKADKEVGGDKLPEAQGFGQKFLNTFATPECRQLIDTYALGKHPEIVRLFSRAGRSISEDTVHLGGTQHAAPRSAEKVLFPNTPSST